MAEYEVIWLGFIAPLLEPLEIALGVGLADDEPLSCLTLDRECHPFPMLVPIDAYISPFEGSGLALPHAGVGHDEQIFPQKGAVSGHSGVFGLFGPPGRLTISIHPTQPIFTCTAKDALGWSA